MEVKRQEFTKAKNDKKKVGLLRPDLKLQTI
jgi:hypothetical protein